jgi:Carboxypeptidase regulatory-like domain
MDAKLFEVLGKYAGLAGLSIGVVLMIFSSLLKLKIFSKLTSANTYALLRQLMYLTFVIGIVGIIAWLSINIKEQASSAITGHVHNGSDKSPIFDAEITVDRRSETSKTDSVGYFSLPFSQPAPTGEVKLSISKQGFQPYTRYVSTGQNLDADIIPAAATTSQNPPDHNQGPLQTTTETYTSDDVASGACKDFGAWATVCTPDKPQGWTIVDQHFDLIGDRAGCRWAECQPLGTITATKACYRFRTQGHDEECHPFSGNTGIQYSKGVLRVIWQHN